MENKNRRTPVQISTAPWKLTLPGKLLTIFVCILPFITFNITRTITQDEHTGFFKTDTTAVVTDFEQLCRELALILVIVAALGWFVYEVCLMQPRRRIPINRITIVMMVLLGGYLCLGLFSTIASDYPSSVWLGRDNFYEGYLALLSYGLLFMATWFYIDRGELREFAQNALVMLGIVIGLLVLLEETGACYYNFSIVQLLGRLGGTVRYETATLTFGNSDYLGIYAAMLLPLLTALIFSAKTNTQMLCRILSAVLMAATLLLTKVSNTIVLGFGTTLILVLVLVLHRLHPKRIVKLSVCGVVVVAILAAGGGFIYTRTGETLSEKLRHTMVGMEQEQTFQLLSIDLEDNAVILENADALLEVVADPDQNMVNQDTLSFFCNGKPVEPYTVAEQPEIGVETIGFTEPELEQCQIEITPGANRLSYDLGYTTALRTTWNQGTWQIEGLGGVILDQDNLTRVSDSKWLQEKYTYLNGRVFVWANTIATSFSSEDPCYLIGHGPTTSVYELNQQDLPALLNIFSQYVLFDKPHNWYLQMVQDTGLLSAVCIVAMLAIFLVYGARVCFSGKQADAQNPAKPQKAWDPWCIGLWTAVLTYALTGMMNDSMIYHAPMFWFLLGLGARAILGEENESAVVVKGQKNDQKAVASSNRKKR